MSRASLDERPQYLVWCGSSQDAPSKIRTTGRQTPHLLWEAAVRSNAAGPAPLMVIAPTAFAHPASAAQARAQAPVNPAMSRATSAFARPCLKQRRRPKKMPALAATSLPVALMARAMAAAVAANIPTTRRARLGCATVRNWWRPSSAKAVCVQRAPIKAARRSFATKPHRRVSLNARRTLNARAGAPARTAHAARSPWVSRARTTANVIPGRALMAFVATRFAMALA